MPITGLYSSKIDALFSYLDKPDQPGLAVGVLKSGKLVHHRGYGVANVEDNLPITDETVFRLCSVTKHMCATAILVLQNRGLLSLDDDIRKYVPEVPDFGMPITLRHLLTMTSGFPDGIAMTIFGGMGATFPLSRHQHLNMVSRQARLMFKPGDDFIYSNTNYALLSLLIERLSGMSLSDFMKKELFEPLEMDNTQMVPDMTEPIRHKARGYVPVGKGGMRTGLLLAETSGDGAADTTIPDMVKWFLNYRDDRLFGPGFRQRLEQEIYLNDGSVSEYRLGINVTSYHGSRKISHTGGMTGYLADFAFYPAEDIGVILLTNWMDPTLIEMSDRIFDIVMNVAPERTAQTEAPPFREGLYICRHPGSALAIRQEGAAIVCYMMGDRSPLVADGQGSFEPSKRGLHYLLKTGSDLEGNNILVRFGAGPWQSFEAVQDHFKASIDMEEYVGFYLCEELGEIHRIQFEDGGLVVELPSVFRDLVWRKLTYRLGEVFTASVVGEPTQSNLTLQFHRDANSQVCAFDYSVYRCRGVRFKKIQIS